MLLFKIAKIYFLKLSGMSLFHIIHNFFYQLYLYYTSLHSVCSINIIDKNTCNIILYIQV